MFPSRIGVSFLTIGPLALALAGCATLGGEPVRTVEVVPIAETEAVATADADAADDPAIWSDPADPARVLILGTDKKAGLYVFDRSGRKLQFLAAGLMNNVDVRDTLVVASDRRNKTLALFRLDPDNPLPLRPIGAVPTDLEEPYGVCLGKTGDGYAALIIGKDGEARQFALATDGSAASARETRRFAVGSQAEGCVFDEAGGHIYVGEEARGVWRYALDPAAGAARTLTAAVDRRRLTADVEGLTIARDGDRRWLIVSSQGDHAFAVWTLGGEQPAFAGRFRVVKSGLVDAVTGTDGVDAGAGLVVMQDHRNDPSKRPDAPPDAMEAQNFKIVEWAAVAAALGL